MARKKRDRDALKQEFLASNFVDVTTFFTEVYKTYNGSMRDNTTGRATEKKRMKQEALKLAEQEYMKENKEKRKTVFKNVDAAHQMILQDIAMQIINNEKKVVIYDEKTKIQSIGKEKVVLSMDQMMAVAKHLRLEKGQSTENIDQIVNDPLRERMNEIAEKKSLIQSIPISECKVIKEKKK